MTSIPNISPTDNIILVVDSKKRYSGTATDFIYRINESIDRIRKITVVQLSLPFSYYTVNSTNNTLVLNNGANIATIPPGTYNLTNFQLTLQAALNAAGPNNGYSVSYNISTGLTTIFNASGVTINSEISQPTSTFATSLGFLSDATGTSVTSDSATNLSGPRFLYVSSRKLCKYFVSQKPRYANNTFSNAIGIILPNVAFGGFISEFTPLEVTISDNKGGASYSTTDNIDFTLYDEFDNIVDLNGLEWWLVLKFEQS